MIINMGMRTFTTNLLLLATFITHLCGTNAGAVNINEGGERNKKATLDSRRQLDGDASSATCFKQVCIDFSRKSNRGALFHGDYINADEWLDTYGVSSILSSAGGKLRIFDTSRFRTEDPELGSPNRNCPGGGPGEGDAGRPRMPGANCSPQGNVLIIDERQRSRPSAIQDGGNITFVFSEPKFISKVGLMNVDSDSKNDYFEMTRASSGSFKQRIVGLGKNGIQDEKLGLPKDITSLSVVFSKTCAIRDICFCNDVGTTVSLSSPRSATLAPIEVTKTANPASVPEPGAQVKFTISIRSKSDERITIESVFDSVYEFLHRQGDCHLPQVIEPGGVYTCSFTGQVQGNAGENQTGEVTVSGKDSNGNSILATGEATVTVVTDVLPKISVVRLVSPMSVKRGDTVHVSVIVLNKSVASDAVTITSLEDSIYGDIDGLGDCTLPVVIRPLSSFLCSFKREVLAPVGEYTGTLTAVGEDDDGNVVTGTGESVLQVTGTPGDDGNVVTETGESAPQVTGTPEDDGTVVTGTGESAQQVTGTPEDDSIVVAETGESAPQVTDKPGECLYGPVCIDFSTADDGKILEHGDYARYQWREIYGMEVQAMSSNGGYTPDGMARIFDTAEEDTEDPDLGAPNEKCNPSGPGIGNGGAPGTKGENCQPQGNVVIIQETNKNEPDDNAYGGNLTFSFNEPVEKMLSIGLLDLSGIQNYLYIEQADGSPVRPKRIFGLGDNSVQEEDIDMPNVDRVTVQVAHSCAVRHICFCPGKALPTRAPTSPTTSPSRAPITPAPSTQAPTTAAPTTATPSTSAPTTQAPMTAAPTTAVPTLAPASDETLRPTRVPTKVPSSAPSVAPKSTPVTPLPTVDENATPAVVGFTLVNADTDEDIGPIVDGVTLQLDALPNINIRADTVGVIGSIQFFVDGVPVQVENFYPYALGGSNDLDYGIWKPVNKGPQTLTAIIYQKAQAGGAALNWQSVTFSLSGSLPGTRSPSSASFISSPTDSPSRMSSTGSLSTPSPSSESSTSSPSPSSAPSTASPTSTPRPSSAPGKASLSTPGPSSASSTSSPRPSSAPSNISSTDSPSPAPSNVLSMTSKETTVVATVADEEVRKTLPYKKLTWDDFPDSPTGEIQESAAFGLKTSGIVTGEPVLVDDAWTIKIEEATASAFMETGGAKSKSATILEHLQYHFDITQYWARQLDRSLKGLVGTGETQLKAFKNIQEEIAQEFSRIDASWNQMREDYDVETSLGNDETKMKEWAEKIGNLLMPPRGEVIAKGTGMYVERRADGILKVNNLIFESFSVFDRYLLDGGQVILPLMFFQGFHEDDSSRPLFYPFEPDMIDVKVATSENGVVLTGKLRMLMGEGKSLRGWIEEPVIVASALKDSPFLALLQEELYDGDGVMTVELELESPQPDYKSSFTRLGSFRFGVGPDLTGERFVASLTTEMGIHS